MAFSILPILESRLGVTVKNITTGLTVFFDLETTVADIDMAAILQTHKLDDGRSIIDSRVTLPVIIGLDGYFTDLDTLDNARTVINSIQDYYSITINGNTWNNMVAVEIGIKQSAEFVSVSPFSCTFSEIMIEQFDYVETEMPADSPSRDQGSVQPGSVVQTVGNFFTELLGKI